MADDDDDNDDDGEGSREREGLQQTPIKAIKATSSRFVVVVVVEQLSPERGRHGGEAIVGRLTRTATVTETVAGTAMRQRVRVLVRTKLRE